MPVTYRIAATVGLTSVEGYPMAVRGVGYVIGAGFGQQQLPLAYKPSSLFKQLLVKPPHAMWAVA